MTTSTRSERLWQELLVWSVFPEAEGERYVGCVSAGANVCHDIRCFMSKRRPLLQLLLAVASVVGLVVSSVAQGQDIERMDIIDLTNGWKMHVSQDGSGQVGFGSSFTDFASFPAGTFALKKVCALLSPKIKDASEKDDVAITLRRPGEKSVHARYIAKSAVAPHLKAALQACTPMDQDRFESVLKSRSID